MWNLVVDVETTLQLNPNDVRVLPHSVETVGTMGPNHKTIPSPEINSPVTVSSTTK